MEKLKNLKGVHEAQVKKKTESNIIGIYFYIFLLFKNYYNLFIQ